MLSDVVLAEPKTETHGPIFDNDSKPSTNSDIILKICHESDDLIAFQFFCLNALIIFFSFAVNIYFFNSLTKNLEV